MVRVTRTIHPMTTTETAVDTSALLKPSTQPDLTLSGTNWDSTVTGTFGRT